MEEIQSRKSIRKFTDKPVERGKIERILQAGQLAPSAKNRQEWRFIVAQRPALREKLQKAAFGQEFVGQAPTVIAVCPTNIDYRMPNGQYSHPVDIGIAAGFMILQATAEGLGSCCVTTFDNQEVASVLSVPYGMPVMLLLLVGYADEDPERPPRKPVKQIAAFNHW